MTHVIIMRGISGSGKTTEAKRWAERVPGAQIVSTDAYMFAGGREFDHTQLERCHEQCKTDFRALLEAETPLVIVDNTNTKFSSIVPYIEIIDELGASFSVFQIHVDPKVAFERGTHKVPLETIEVMAIHMWSEHLPSTWDVWTKGAPWRPVRSKREPLTKPAPEIIVKPEEPRRHNGPISLSESGSVLGCQPSGIVSVSQDPDWR